MHTCPNCHRNFSGYERYCSEPCEEFAEQVHREEHGIECTHCHVTFQPGGFEQHQWRMYYRTGEFPIGRRVRT